MPLNTVFFKTGDFSIAWETDSNIFNLRVHRAGLLVTYSGTYGFHQLPLSSWQPPDQGFTFRLTNVPSNPLHQALICYSTPFSVSHDPISASFAKECQPLARQTQLKEVPDLASKAWKQKLAQRPLGVGAVEVSGKYF